ncbi:hypothetical protein BD626DRAFT_578464 [Schizophyllum amplum]|uniref:Uncharacterized protein n=1 Tax=Schizophyllum amplum TaxID=97359 RepID=A0A550BRZ6_9AGAR|nr:hypothetical protein BD626DRAFT_578464 [Auriculariopsis ampla]
MHFLRRDGGHDQAQIKRANQSINCSRGHDVIGPSITSSSPATTSKTSKSSAAPSSNWAALAQLSGTPPPPQPLPSTEQPATGSIFYTLISGSQAIVNGESLPALRQIVLWKTQWVNSDRPRDAMVHGFGSKPSLARVNLDHFNGAIPQPSSYTIASAS